MFTNNDNIHATTKAMLSIAALLKSPSIIGLASTSYLPTTKEFDTELFSEQVLSPKNKEFAKEMAQ